MTGQAILRPEYASTTIPSKFVTSNFDPVAVLKDGLTCVLEVDGALQPDTYRCIFSTYFDTNGYEFFTTPGLATAKRKFSYYKVDKWEKVDDATFKLCISTPEGGLVKPPPKRSRGDAAGEGGEGKKKVVR